MFGEEKETIGFFKALEKNVHLSVIPKKKSPFHLAFSVYSHKENSDYRRKIHNFEQNRGPWETKKVQIYLYKKDEDII